MVRKGINADDIILNPSMPSRNISIHSQHCNVNLDADRCLSVHIKFRHKSSPIYKASPILCMLYLKEGGGLVVGLFAGV